ncbi:MAG TPA: S8/S53 family peptidase [Bacteroidales bacterium]|nr:S8/S53 family peptidase [Bacteroidales bacterium]HPB25186.1 S8/S53 family peptidase [Bacteroidales bacterium]HPI30216.1 S8/S53 family peptidase [Bacteroidales bacterium]HQN15521.1 S8/S53 family peptidase [Bacteroidales bacterium]HQP14813.1 S8/S53 family peptidase [Bacteroidales bacterium]
MKKTGITAVFLLLFAAVSAQTSISADTHLFIADLKTRQTQNNSYYQEYFQKKYPIRIVKDKHYIACLAKTNDNYNPQTLVDYGIIPGSKTGNIITLLIPLENFDENISIPGITYLEIAARARPFLDRAIPDTRVDSVWQGIDLPQPFTGKDVLIGITDWGFDYTNPMFYDTTLSHTRIVKAWDQWRTAGPPPSGYTYGTEISGETNLLAAQCDTFNVYEWATHGSHVAGICGGSGAGTIYRGIAYEANYLMATFLVDMAAVLDAYNWMYDYAISEGKRLVINQSWGLFWTGTLDGTSLLSQAIDTLSAAGVVFVSSGGNNGNEYFHLKHTFSGPADTMKTQVEFDYYAYYPKMWGQSVSIWGEPLHSFDISVKVLNNLDQIIASSPEFSTNNADPYFQDSLIIGSDTIFYNLACDSAHPQNNRPHMRLRVRNLNTSLYKIALFARADSGTIHCWNLIELTNDVGNWGSPLSALYEDWANGDLYYGIGEPACTKSVITVAAHLSEKKLTNGTIVGGTIANFSSYGPTYDGRLKPDISAPGVGVVSSVSSFTNQALSTPSASINFGGRTYDFVPFSGTSMSAPMVTGIVALMLQANPTLTPQQIKEIIIETAREDNRTGNIPDTGSYVWGWGKVHAWRAIKTAYAGISEPEGDTEQVLVWPNPAKEVVYLMNETATGPMTVNIYNTFGRLVASQTITQNRLNVGHLSAGIYFLEIISKNNSSMVKLVKQ